MNLVPPAIIAVMLLHIVMIIAPGSDYALIMRTVGKRGKSAGIFMAIGFGLGGLTLLLIAILGINSLLSKYPFLMTTVRYLGAGWLLWQAVLSILPEKRGLKFQRLGSLGAGFINHFINVEMIIFYVAAISQLGVRNISSSAQLLTALVMAAFTTVWFLCVTYLIESIPHSHKILNHTMTRLVFGVLFLASALGLVLA